MQHPSALPELTPAQSAHSARLVDRIHDVIDAQAGWINFERFMEMALYEPGLGYYSAGSSKLGAGGDFVTAPEVSSLFSRCLATQCAEILQHVSGGAILEFGAGSGVMAADLLNELGAQGALPERYFILEVSADLRERQQALVRERAPAHAARVEWLDRLPEEFRGVVLANEVLDALPVQRFRIRGDQVTSLGVTWQLGRLDWSETIADPQLEAAVRRIETNVGERMPDGYTSEINLRLAPWIAGVAAALREGVALFIDYGLPQRQYYRSARREGTLLCHFRHRFHDDPLINVGVQDIGAWVDFTAVAEAASTAGLKVAGFATQAPIANDEIASRVQLARQAMLLTLPGEMGERFKVIGLTRNFEQPLRGFAVRDLAATL
jgi:SAM-dependent MidA family methyltransferase